MTAPKPKTSTKTAPKGALVVRKKIDWAAAEREFRTGRYSQIELCRKHGMAEATLSRRIKADQETDKSRWQPDLTLAVQQATDAALIAELVNSDIKKSQEQGQEQNTAIVVAAEIGKNVIMGHRQDLKRLSDVKMKLLAQIEQAVDNMTDLAEVIEMVRSPDDNGVDRANDALKKAMARSALVDDLKKLSDTDEKVRKGEREAFKLDAAPPPPANEESQSDEAFDLIKKTIAKVCNGIA